MIADTLRHTQRINVVAFITRIPAQKLWFAVAYAALVIIALVKGYAGNDLTFGDSDDAARLLQVREFLGGQSWYDTATYAMGGAAGMLSHWSRLIDLPIAALISALSIVVPHHTAEAITLMIWPLIVLAPLTWAIVSTSVAKGGSLAGSLSALLLVLCPLGVYQFATGRIDHHNVMIAATVSAALLLWANPGHVRVWKLAGALCGLALAVGYEALAPVLVIMASAAVWGLLDRQVASAAQGLTVAFIATFAACFVLTISPDHWLVAKCDAISLNLVALSAIAGSGLLVVLGRGQTWPLHVRLAVLAVATGVGLAVFGGLEPKCLAGPMGQLPAELKSVWLNYVAEARSIARDLAYGNIEQSLGLIAFMCGGIGAQICNTRLSRSAPDFFLLAVAVAVALLACWQFKYVSYASLLFIPPLALAISRLQNAGEISATTVRFGTAAALSQAVLLLVSGAADARFAPPKPMSKELRAQAETCSSAKALHDLGDLPPGLISAHIDIGAFIATLTPHRALSAPYHRIPDAIIANNTILESRNDTEALALLSREQIDYIVICRGLDDPFADSIARRGTLRSRLVANDAPTFLLRVPLSNPDSEFKVWRVKKPNLNPQL